MVTTKSDPLILLVYSELSDELHYIPNGGTLFDWTKRKDLLEHSCSRLIQAICSAERSNPGNNIYIIPWDETLRTLLSVRFSRIISIVPKWLKGNCPYVGPFPEVTFRLDNGLTMKDIKPWMFKCKLPMHRWLATIFPNLRKFI